MENTLENQPAPSQSLLGAYFQFLRTPNLIEAPASLSFNRIRNHILRLYTPHLLATLLIAIVISQVVTEADNILFEDILSELSAWLILFGAVVMAPVVEEIIFRLPLRPIALSLSIPISIAIIYLLDLFSVNQAIPPVVGLMLLGFNIYLATRHPKVPRLQQLYTRFPRPIFYLSAILFGAIHIGNYDSRVWALMPLLVLPQCVLGLFLGFVRVRYGFGWAIFAHALHNGCLIAPFLMMLGLGSSELRSQIGQGIDFEALTLLDKLLTTGLGLYFISGLALCVITAWKVIREWQYAS
ncbi:MAG: CPBP family intramembrane metalloprotease [Leptolyngbyaceae cyanobacterium MO_188.B28]|nr:CPBP family intramembrane metalloprotease [Leptolyngbyaceae cyanobacterium MO_188.B28]